MYSVPQNESIEDIESSLFTLLESQRKVEELLKVDSENDELKRVKVDVDLAIEDLKRRMRSKSGTSKSLWSPGDICEILWSNDVWYKAFVIKRIEKPAVLWRVGLLGYGLEKEVDASRLRRQELVDWRRGMKCLLLEGYNSSQDVYERYVSNAEGGSTKLCGRYIPAVIDAVMTSESTAWVMLLESGSEKNGGNSRKASFDLLEKTGKATPVRSNDLSDCSEDKKNLKEKGAKKRERFIKKQEHAKKKIDDSFHTWKKHFRGG
ncbi:survival motor neuron domain containing 1-like protein [Perkinsela sp. CCAP 1560/4]|nr:survival motor neuron domain containing 1-like protein [Perkinsela sp. CCAP 1560/4]|eukprot:KNH08986.1 survival motor neuron domain containing 1-like protein [Perkinsela sp. CCAP 1560/4]